MKRVRRNVAMISAAALALMFGLTSCGGAKKATVGWRECSDSYR